MTDPNPERLANEQTLRSQYRQVANRKLGFGIACFVLVIVIGVYSIAVGAVNIPVADVVSALLGQGGQINSAIIWKIRLPRILSAIIAGLGLAIAGAAMQNVLRNPLGSPFTLGISQAAAFGAAFSIVILGTGSVGTSAQGTPIVASTINSPYVTTITAFLAAMLSTAVILLLVHYKSASPETMILAGVALGSLFTAGMTLIQYFASDVEVAAIVFWTFGDLGRSTWSNFVIMSLIVVAGTAYFVRNAWNYNVMDAGEDTAKSLGVNVERLRILGMVVASLVAAVITAFVGIIGFVGLVAPHIVRKVIGSDERYLIPASSLVGALLLLASDTVARTVIAPIVLPVGILTSFLGAPLFLYLVITGRDYW